MMPLDLTALTDLMEDLRHSTGEKCVEHRQALHEQLDLADIVWGLNETRAVLRSVEWASHYGEHRACPSCGSPAIHGHLDDCRMAKIVGWLA